MIKIHDSIKTYTSGVGKVISPRKTFQTTLRKLKAMRRPILDEFFEIKRPSKIPQYRFYGTDYYRQIALKNGTNGKGHSKFQALASGIMELVERYSCYKYLRSLGNAKIASFRVMENSLFNLQDVWGNFFDENMTSIFPKETILDCNIKWFKAYSLGGKEVYLPQTFIRFILQGTNGMAAGNSLEEALLHGICEVIERHAIYTVLIKKIRVPAIQENSITNPIAKKLIAKFKLLKQSVSIKDFSLNIGIAVIGVVRKVQGQNCIVTVGVATDPNEALIRALTENSQIEAKENYIPNAQVNFLFESPSRVTMQKMPNIAHKNIRVELELVEKILSKQDMRIFFHDATDQELLIPSVIVYITQNKYFAEDVLHRNMLMAIIEEYLSSERYSEALYFIRKFESLDKRNLLIYEHYKGIALRAEEKYKEAIRCLEAVAGKVKHNTKNYIQQLRLLTLIHLGLCYVAQNTTEKAIKTFLEVLTQKPDFSFEALDLYYNTMNSKNIKLKRKKAVLRTAHSLLETLKKSFKLPDN